MGWQLRVSINSFNSLAQAVSCCWLHQHPSPKPPQLHQGFKEVCRTSFIQPNHTGRLLKETDCMIILVCGSCVLVRCTQSKRDIHSCCLLEQHSHAKTTKPALCRTRILLASSQLRHLGAAATQHLIASLRASVTHDWRKTGTNSQAEKCGKSWSQMQPQARSQLQNAVRFLLADCL